MPVAPVLGAHPSVTSAASVAIPGTAVGAANVEVTTSSGKFTVPVSQGTFNALVPLPTKGVHSIAFRALSPLGTKSSPTVTTVARDLEPPKIKIAFPVDGTEYTIDPISVSGEALDLLGGGPGLTVTVNGSPAQVFVAQGGLTSFLAPSVDLDNSGAPTPITVVATDVVGNQATTSIAVSYAGVPPGKSSMLVVSGNGQIGVVDQELPQPIVVKILDGSGSPFPGKLASFQVDESNGLLSSTSGGPGSLLLQVPTDSNGLASVFWRLGSDVGVGNNRVVVTSKDILGTTVFIASAQPGIAAQISVNSGDELVAEAGTLAPLPLRVRVSDGQNGISGVSITFAVASGGGLVNGQPSVQVVSDALGYAQVAFQLGPQPGLNSVEADFTGSLGLPAAFSLLGIERVPGESTSLSGLVTDGANHPLQGVACSVIEGGSSVGLATSDAQGRFQFTSLPASGAVTLLLDGGTATAVEGTPVPPGSYCALPVQLLLVPQSGNPLPSPVALPPRDPQNSVVFDNTQQKTLTIAGLDGLVFTVKAGSMTLADGSIPSPSSPALITLNLLSVAQLPCGIPDGGAPALAWVLEPFGATFDPPIDYSLPNLSALAANSQVYLWGFDPNGGNQNIVGGGGVSGVATKVGPGSGIPNAGIGFMVPPFSQSSTISTPDVCLTSPGDIPTTVLLPVAGGTIRADACGSGAFGAPHGSEDNPGVDIEGTLGAAVVTVYDGVVVAVQSGCVPDVGCSSASQSCGSGYGNFVVLAHSVNAPSLSMFYTAYAQLDMVFVNVGDTLLAGNALGTLGQTGNANPACFTCAIDPYVHFELSAIAPPLSADAPRCDPSVFLLSLPPPGGGGPPSPDFAAFTGSLDFEAGGHSGLPTAGALAVVTGVPASVGSQVALRATWTVGDSTLELRSPFLNALPGGVQSVSALDLDPDGPPVQLSITTPTTIMTTLGQTAQLSLTATDEAGGVRDVTLQAQGTSYSSSDPSVVSVGRNGLMTAVASGTVWINATNEGVVDLLHVDALLGDELTTVQGFVVLQDGSPVNGAEVNVVPSNLADTTDSSGFFSISGVPSLQGDLTLFADAEASGQRHTSTVTGIVPLPDNITDAGVIELEPAVYWNVDASGSWSTGSNWNTGVVPQAGDNVVIDRPAGSFTITLAGTSANVKSVRCKEGLVLGAGGILEVSKPFQVNSSFTISGGSLQNATLLPGLGGAGLVVNGSGSSLVNVELAADVDFPGGGPNTLQVTNGLTLSGGTITLSGGINSQNLNFNGTQTLGGTGEIHFATDSNSNRVRCLAGTTLTIGSGVIIHGRGWVEGVSGGTFVNQGTLRADAAGSQPLTLSATGWQNQSLVEAASGGDLTLTGSGWNNSATVSIGGGGDATLSGSGWTNAGTISMAGGGALTLDGTFANTATLTSTGSIVNLAGSFNVSSLGTFTFSGGEARITGTLSGGTLDISGSTAAWKLHNTATVANSTLATAGGQAFEVIGSASQLDGATLAGGLSLPGGGPRALQVVNGLTLSGGTITLSGGINSQNLNFNGTQTLGGTGEIHLATDESTNRVRPLAGTTLTIGPGVTIRGRGRVEGVSGGTFINQGTLRADAAGSQPLTLSATGWQNQSLVEAASGGDLTLTGSGWNNSATVSIGGGGDATLSGSGWTNAGTISMAGGGALTLDGTFANTATLTSTGSIVDLAGSFDVGDLGTSTFSGGEARITGTLSGGTLDISGSTAAWKLYNTATVANSTLATAGGQAFEVVGSASQLDGATLAGGLNLPGGGPRALQVVNGLTLSGGTITLSGGINSQNLNFNGTQTLGGTGEIHLATDESTNRVRPLAGTTLTIGPGVTIRGRGRVEGVSGGTFVNQGTLRADAAGSQPLTLSATGWQNQGTIEALASATISSPGVYTQTSGKTNLSGGTLTSVGLVDIQGGEVSGNGTINGSVQMAGTILPGGTGEPGTITVTGTYTQAAAGTLAIELGGLTAGSQYDRLVVTSTATLDGTLSVSLIKSFSPSSGNLFDVLTRASGTGTFATVNLPTGTWQVDYNPTEVRLTRN